jgi:hypothetical protein
MIGEWHIHTKSLYDEQEKQYVASKTTKHLLMCATGHKNTHITCKIYWLLTESFVCEKKTTITPEQHDFF